MSLRDLILDVDDISSEEVDVPQWGVRVLVKGMSARDRLRIMQTATDPNTGEVDVERVYPDVIIATVHDPESGLPVFTDEDRGAILSKSYGAVEALASAGLRLSAIAPAQQDALGKDS